MSRVLATTLPLWRALGAVPAARTYIFDALREAQVRHRSPYRWRERVRWPIVQALLSGDRTHRFRLANGLVFEVAAASGVEKAFLLSPERHPGHFWEPQTTRLLSRIAERGRQVLVGGAYIGDQVLFIARALVPNAGTVHAFEPMAITYQRLRRNCALNGASNVRTHQLGLWERSGARLRLDGLPALATSKAVDDGAPGSAGAIETVSIDDYVSTNAIEHLDLVMLDMEGGELAALRGAERELGRDPSCAPDIIFETHSTYADWSRGLAQTEAVRYLTGLGYSVYALRDYQNNVPTMEQLSIEVVDLESAITAGPPHGFNLFATKKPDRLAELELRLVHGVSPKLLLDRYDPKHRPLDEQRSPLVGYR